jgi:transposase-like protein
MNARQTYSAEFRAEAVKLLHDQGLSQGEAAARLGIPKGTLAKKARTPGFERLRTSVRAG